MRFLVSDEQSEKIGIYCIRNIIDDARYIGQTTESFYKRWLRHSNMLQNNKHFNKHLQKAYNKYKDDNFEFFVVATCNNLNEISYMEEQYISDFRSKCKCYNYLSGGPTMCGENNPFFGRKHTEETLKKLSESSKGRSAGEKNNFYGVDHSGEKNGFFGKHHTEESKRKMSIAKSNMYKGENNPFYGKKHKPETLEKLKQNGLNAYHKEIICLETGTKYRSGREAERQTGISSKRISDVCNGKQRTAGGLHWIFYSEKQEDTG